MKLFESTRSTPLLVAACCVLLLARSGEAADPGPDFDHTATRFVLTGSHESVPCKGCHGQGVFEGTPTECGYCHDGSGTRAESGKPMNHIPTQGRCDDCHTTFTWLEVRFDHLGVTGACVACHNGTTAEGKPFEHIQTAADCDVCHNDFAWNVVRFDHSGITEPCSFCHNGTMARGKEMDHVQTSSECDVCHRTQGWRPAFFDHSSVTEPCSSCHNGTNARGVDMDHLQTMAECDLCHSTRGWTPVSFDHSGVMGSCSGCHNGMEATGPGNGHFMTMLECDTCHTTMGWRPDTFSHMSPNYPGDHRANLDCTECHPGNSDPVVYKDDPGLAPDCAGCHRNDYKSGPHLKYEQPETRYRVDELRDCTGSCHVYRDSTETVRTKTRNGRHHVSDREFGD